VASGLGGVKIVLNARGIAVERGGSAVFAFCLRRVNLAPNRW